MGGFRESLDFLDASLEILDDLSEPARATQVRLLTASVKRQAGQYQDAERLLLEKLAAGGTGSTPAGGQFQPASGHFENQAPLRSRVAPEEADRRSGVEVKRSKRPLVELRQQPSSSESAPGGARSIRASLGIAPPRREGKARLARSQTRVPDPDAAARPR